MAAEDTARMLSGRKVLLGVTGGIAAYKSAYLARLIMEAGAEVEVIMTASATRFVGPDTFAALTGRPVRLDPFEEPGSVPHVRLAHEADVAVVAPATANLLARLSIGLADDLLSATLLEASCPLVLAPAMHWGMWENPATRENVARVRDRGAVLVGPAVGPLAAGDEGIGRMAEPEEILQAVVDVLASGRDLAGRRVLVTAGPTREPIDDVRYVGNRSSGRMGFALAEEAFRRGAAVTLVTGPVELPPPAGVDVVRVETAEEMAGTVFDSYGSADAVVMAAAVSDFRPAQRVSGKLKKQEGPPQVALAPTTDILATLGKRKEHQILIGFAAETDNLESEARRKLAEKNLDLIVVNEVGRPGSGFGSVTNRAAVLSSGDDDAPIREWTKLELAREICDRLVDLLG